MRAAFRSSLLFVFVLLLFLNLPALSLSSSADREPVNEALRWVRESPSHLIQYDYTMTARLRLLFFWAGKDDVGGGYIRRGVSANDPRLEFIQVLFGSDPAKAPRAINRWGAGTEVSWHQSPVTSAHPGDDVTASAFFGFMKSELEREKQQGLHAFTGILSRVETDQALSLIVPLESNTDYNLRDYDRAEPVMLDRLATFPRPLRTLQDSRRCRRSAEFLATVADLIDDALAGKSAPSSRCYVYDAQENTLTLDKIAPVPALNVRVHGPNNVALLNATHKNVLQLDFVSTHKLTGKKVYFTLYVGTEGALRGVPVQICYQPNWWFQIVLNLLPDKSSSSDSAIASR